MKIGIFDPAGKFKNPLTNSSYTFQYTQLAKQWSTFPAYTKRREIVQSLIDHQILLIVSGTGSGKTVIVPKLALHYTNYKGKVVVVLPKKAITLSAATFAADTLDVQLGNEVGYQYKGSNKQMRGNDSVLSYVTDGILVNQYLTNQTLSDINVIVIDEAHERKIQTDLILLALKTILLSKTRPDLRVIIMSATIDTQKYLDYFNNVSNQLIHISGIPNYPIVTQFLTKPTTHFIQTGYQILTNILQTDTVNAILFFVTTGNEARQVCQMIGQSHPGIYCIEVYADMPENLKIYATSKDKFLEMGSYHQKVIIATNVAESSLTIDGLKYVIDCGYELTNTFNPIVGGNILKKRLITRAQALQRRGRVGRTDTGSCFHLLTAEQFNQLLDYPLPTILTTDITLPLLSLIKITHPPTYQNGYQMINHLMDVPHSDYIEYARSLYSLYSLLNKKGKLQPMGQLIAQITTLSFSQILFCIDAYFLRCAKEAIIIIVMMEMSMNNLNHLFYSSLKKGYLPFAHKSGDHLTYLAIYQRYEQAENKQSMCEQYQLKDDLLQAIKMKVKDYYYRIISLCKTAFPNKMFSKDTLTTRLMIALKNSHQHLKAKNNTLLFPLNKTPCVVSKNSVLVSQNLKDKNLIYEDLIQISNQWELVGVSIIQ